MINVPEIFGSMVFNDSVMKNRLPKDAYFAVRRTIEQGTHLELNVANIVASVMKDWAIEKGATHYTHWFQPMTGVTAEKHTSFITPISQGRIIMQFSGSELVRGEPDASSFPSGGLRAIFEARGYTAWDPTSYAFIKDNTLCIPTAFCSYSGEALDKKTPLLRSMEALDKQTLRILRLFGNTDVSHTNVTIGPEQEYFLISKEMYLKRPDLIYTGRTLFGARPPKGQELDDHYFGAIKPQVASFMRELNEELWQLGILSDTEHNEVAPSQHELTPIYATANIATDHNQLTMELMRKIADKHGLTCLLHEKPFAGVNGSGKHNNWSISTDTGVNLFEPGDTPHDNAQFLLFLVAAIKAVDDYQDLLRISVASAGNDHRLGANEAPPAVISIFLGDELTEILTAIEEGTDYKGREKIQMEIGVTVLPHFPKDMTDRNRTSPFAFTGNKFEFRMLGSASSVAEPNVVLNTAVAYTLAGFAEELEGAEDFFGGVSEIVRRTIREHKRIIFNGNGYDGSWHEEAERLGLSNLKTTPEALDAYLTDKNIELFKRMSVYTEKEMESRHEIFLENYSKTINIEAITMIDLVRREIIPAVLAYENELAELLSRKENLGGRFDASLEAGLLGRISQLGASLSKKLTELETETVSVRGIQDSAALAMAYRERVFSAMNELRAVVDELELTIPSKHWTLPTYGEILYSVI